MSESLLQSNDLLGRDKDSFVADHRDLLPHVQDCTSCDAQDSSSENKMLLKQHPALAHFQELKKIGFGSQGTMLRGKDEQGNWVAIKVFNIKTADSLKSLELFEREIATLKTLNVPGVPKYIDTIETPDYIYLVEEFIHAPSLDKRIKDGQRYAFEEILKILLNTAQILKQIEELVPPVIHRDIKPSNLLVDDDENVWIVDFGVVAAKPLDSNSMTFAGTVGYMAPEQLYGKVTPATDVFSLGMSILHLVTHVSPGNMMNENMEIRVDQYIPSNIPKWFISVLKKMIAPNVAFRLKNGDEIIKCLKTDCRKELINVIVEKRIGVHNTENVLSNAENKSTQAPKGEKEIRELLKPLYKSCNESLHDLCLKIRNSFFAMVACYLFSILPIYFVYYLVMKNPLNYIFTYWLTAALPFVVVILYAISSYSVPKNNLKEERMKYVMAAIEMNELYKDEIVHQTRPSDDGLIQSAIFIELRQKVKTPQMFPSELTKPLDYEEDLRLNEYLKDERVLYPCVEYKFEYEPHIALNVLAVIAWIIGIAASMVLLFLLDEHELWWSVIYYGACAFFVVGMFTILVLICYRKRVLHRDSRNQDAYQLFVRRFVSECRNTIELG